MRLFRKREANTVGDIISQPKVDIPKLKQAVFQSGIKSNADRATVWKLVLNCYTPNKQSWEATDQQLHKDYLSFYNDYFPPESEQQATDKNEDQLLLYEIDKDVKRLFPKSSFFIDEKNRECIRHILYIQTKFNKTYQYIQGMNDICGVLFYVFSLTASRAHAESTTYYCFAFLMTRINDWYSSKCDMSSKGIHATLRRVDAILKLKEPQVYNHLMKLNITNVLYSFRWVTLLFSQEFPIDDVLSIWDVILVDHTNDFVCCFCVSMVCEIKKQLLVSDFSDCLKLLQKYPSTNVKGILERAKLIFSERSTFPPLTDVAGDSMK